MGKSSDFNIHEYQQSLTQVSSHTSENRFLHRLHCVILIGQGCSYSQVSNWFGEHPRTVERWVQHAREFGVEGLRDEEKTGRPTRVRDDQKSLLKIEITQAPEEFGYRSRSWNGRLLQLHLKNRYHIDLGLRQCQRLFNELKVCDSASIA